MATLKDRQCVLVTGGAGFIGSHLVEHLAAAGCDITVVDDLSTGCESNLRKVRDEFGEKITFVHGDLAHWLDEDGASMRFDQVYHLAAAVGVRLVVEDPIRTIETNISQTMAVLCFARKNRTPLLLASTSEVYGKGLNPRFSEDDDMVYGPTSRSRWSYACSKAIDEYLALANHRDHRLPVTIARFFNTVGPRQVGEYGMVLPRFIERALRNDPIEVYGDGNQTRCFCDVRDVVPVLPRLLSTPSCEGNVLNIGSDHQISIHDLALLVKSELSSSSDVVVVPYENAYTEGFEDLQVRVPDLTRIREAVGFEASIPIETTIRDIAATMASKEVAP